jgi:O-antigen/teichoic acid export membrane protein
MSAVMPLLVRFAFRSAALALKFALTIIVARTLGFGAVADYGMAVAISVVSSKLLGLGFSTEINRRLSIANPARAIDGTRRLLLLYCAIYAVIAILITTVYYGAGFEAIHRITPGILWSVILVVFSEHAGLEATSYVFSLHRQNLGAWLLFIRTGAWAGCAIVGLLAGTIHSVEMVFTLWWGTNVLAVLAAWCCISHRRRELSLLPGVDAVSGRGSFRAMWVDGLPFFVATTLLAALQYGERFLASHVLSADILGRYVFAWSISNAIQTIAYATVVVTAGPRLVRSMSAGGSDFRAILRRSLRSSIVITLLTAAVILIAHTPIFRLARQATGERDLAMLVTLLVSFVLRSISDVVWTAAIALRLGKKVAFAIFCTTLVTLPIEWLLIDSLGEMGPALAHLTASIGIAVMLGFIVARAHGRALSGEVVENGETLHAS